MSTNENPRPLSRRFMLTAGTAAVATAGATVPVLAAAPDPVFAALEAERIAFAVWNAAIYAQALADEALYASGWSRKPRVLVGEFTSFVRGPDHEHIRLDERVAQPVYVHDEWAIDRDCDDRARSPGADPVEVEARRARLHRELAEDAAAIEAAPEVVASREADAKTDAMGDLATAAFRAVLKIVPTTVPGLLALLDCFERYTEGSMVSHEDDGLNDLLASIRSFLAGRA